jgi:hypothetical protein
MNMPLRQGQKVAFAVAGVSTAVGNLVIFHAIYFGTRPRPPPWQAIGVGVAHGLFKMPFFIAISRAP